MAIKAGEDTFYQAKRGIVQDGLVLNLDAGVDESYSGGTTWTNLSGNDNGTLTNGPTFDRDKGGSFSFDGTDEYIQSSLVLGAANTSFTLSVWMKLISFNGPNTSVVFSNYGVASTTALYGVVANDASNPTSVRLDARSSGGVLAQSSFIDISDDTIFNHITIVRDSSNDLLYLYVNNTNTSIAFLGSYDIRSTGDNNGEIFTGRHLNTYNVGGNASIVAYNRALTSDEIARNYNATRHRFGV